MWWPKSYKIYRISPKMRSKKPIVLVHLKEPIICSMLNVTYNLNFTFFMGL